MKAQLIRNFQINIVLTWRYESINVVTQRPKDPLALSKKIRVLCSKSLSKKAFTVARTNLLRSLSSMSNDTKDSARIFIAERKPLAELSFMSSLMTLHTSFSRISREALTSSKNTMPPSSISESNDSSNTLPIST